MAKSRKSPSRKSKSRKVMSLEQLRTLAKKHGIKVSGLNKAALKTQLQKHRVSYAVKSRKVAPKKSVVKKSRRKSRKTSKSRKVSPKKSVMKSRRKSRKASRKPCKANQVRDVLTKRCRAKKSRGRKPMKSRKVARKSPARKSRKVARKSPARKSRKVARKSPARKSRKVSRKNSEKKTSTRKSPKLVGKQCLDNGDMLAKKGQKYLGNEPSPKGLGLCAHNRMIEDIERGRNGFLWQVVKGMRNGKPYNKWKQMTKTDLAKYPSDMFLGEMSPAPEQTPEKWGNMMQDYGAF